MPDAVKAARYIELLDSARCEDGWDEVPELVRKVRKHAPERNCLTLTAEIENAIARASQLPVTATGVTSDNPAALLSIDVSTQLPRLMSAIDAEQRFPEERYQAQVCVGWLHWVLKEYSLATVRLPKTFDQEFPEDENVQNIADWTKVCALKSAYLQANCLARNEKRDEALEAFDHSLPSLNAILTTHPARKQLRYWSELYLTEYCMLSSQTLQMGKRMLTDPNCLACFRAWSQYWSASKGMSLVGGYGFRGAVPRRQIWREYYSAISEILVEDHPFPAGYVAVNSDDSVRSQLRAELKHVEMIYQGLLFSETTFPQAEEQRQEVEEFVQRLMQNWAILNGRGWRDADLGPGGRETLSRGVLESLFAAATKTFHSTTVLRYLFTVYLALAEFELAFKAFDSWKQLIERRQARAEMTRHAESNLDEEATVLEAYSACITALCRYGDRNAAEKACNLAKDLEEILAKLDPCLFSPRREHGRTITYSSDIPLNILALAWQSVGLAHAQWARMTFDSGSRTGLQEKAIQCLRRSLSQEYGRAADLRAVFALGLLYAERRKLAVAIDVVKSALLASNTPEEKQELYNGPYWRERGMIPLWHLLALMLSARQDYVMAAWACEGAIEQFKDPIILFGGRSLNGPFRSDHLNESEAAKEKTAEGAVDDMDDYEKQSILEIKMTQLAILELVEGPAVAVNASKELLALFPRLFGALEQTADVSAKTGERLKTTSTLRSFRSSIFGSRSQKPGKTDRQSVIEKMPTLSSRPESSRSAETVTPAIQVTNDQGETRPTRDSERASSVKRRSLSARRTSTHKRDSTKSRKRAFSSGNTPRPPTDPATGGKFNSPLNDIDIPKGFSLRNGARSPHSPLLANTGGSTPSHTQDSTTAAASPDEAENSVIDIYEVETFAAVLPRIFFPQEHLRRRRYALLVKVWLLIASFYRRARQHQNAQEACSEAATVVQAMEAEISKDTTGLVSLRNPGWGENKSLDELMADVWCEKAKLSVAKEKPYVARSQFETALTHYPDHSSSIVGLSSILLDVYSEVIVPPPAIPGLGLPDDKVALHLDTSTDVRLSSLSSSPEDEMGSKLPSGPLGLGSTLAGSTSSGGNPYVKSTKKTRSKTHAPLESEPPLQPPYKSASLPLVDRLAARDRATMLLSGLTKLGTGWNDSEAWFSLARAYEESGQTDKAKEALWWCVELEDGQGVREWGCVGTAGYTL